MTLNLMQKGIQLGQGWPLLESRAEKVPKQFLGHKNVDKKA